MWNLTDIRVRNIVSFKDAEFSIPQGVATLIFGKNEDNASQPCNGSGKSALVEAISFGLTGEQLRKVKSVEDIINDQAQEASVWLRLENDYDGAVLEIDRSIRRGAPQSVSCVKRDSAGAVSEANKMAQPTVVDCNKLILSELGLSKDDLYNFFILCDSKSESFFDAPDKTKKEIVNRFSNGFLVDECVERLQADLAKAEAEERSREASAMRARGAVKAIEDELAQAAERAVEAARERELRIASLDRLMAECRERVDAACSAASKAEERLLELRDVRSSLSGLEGSGEDVEAVYALVRSMLSTAKVAPVSDYGKILYECGHEAEGLAVKSAELSSSLEEGERVFRALSGKLDAAKARLSEQALAVSEKNAEDEAAERRLEAEIAEIDKKLDGIEAAMAALKKDKGALEAAAAAAAVRLAGAVSCPKCGHEFFPGGGEVERVREEAARLESAVKGKEAEISNLDGEFGKLDEEALEKSELASQAADRVKAREQALDELRREVRSACDDADSAKETVAEKRAELVAARGRASALESRIGALRSGLFTEALAVVDAAISSGEAYLAQKRSEADFARGQLGQHRSTRVELESRGQDGIAESLACSLDRRREEMAVAERELSCASEAAARLRSQEANFTLFKSHLARKKIAALSAVVDDFLERIGSDIRLRLEGFTLTKSGKVRDRISVQVLRDGVDCGSYHKFSGGERARLNLACILALHSLTNASCEDGKGLGLLVIDEVLDKTDEEGIASCCDALNRLGQTCLMITQGAVSEGYPHRVLVIKSRGVSRLTGAGS